ncbi:MAG: hypothetical protein IJ438_01125 [Clostridia bacterium]|nr:hypothetical protein [Clostridia bacterium]MBQ8313692.1 hypothetical protein [Clostridia bacterium]MBQ8554450.1 hypothetical protein [Clostridia bacterium]
MGINVTNDQHLSKYITVPTENGRPQRVATMIGRVAPGVSMNLSLMVANAELAGKYQAEIATALDEMWNDLRAKAAEAGLPV